MAIATEAAIKVIEWEFPEPVWRNIIAANQRVSVCVILSRSTSTLLIG